MQERFEFLMMGFGIIMFVMAVAIIFYLSDIFLGSFIYGFYLILTIVFMVTMITIYGLNKSGVLDEKEAM